MHITWAEIAEGLENQVTFTKPYSPLYHAVFTWLHEATLAHLNAETLTPGQAAFVSLVEQTQETRPNRGQVFITLLLAGAVHAAVLNEDLAAQSLRPFYASVGGTFDPERDSAALSEGLAVLFSGGGEALEWFLREGDIQTNEVSRSAAWLLPSIVMNVWQPELHISLIEFGPSAGLNLAADHFFFNWNAQDTSYTLNANQDAPLVTQTLHLEDPADPNFATWFPNGTLPRPNIFQRVGIDLSPLDIFNEAHYLMLQACIWADNVERMRRLERARDIFKAMVESGEKPRLLAGDIQEAATLIPNMLPKDLPKPHLVLVYNSAVTGYFNDVEYDRLRARIMASLSSLPEGVTGLWLENEWGRYNETPDREGLFMIKARLPFMGGISSLFLGELEAHPTNVYLRPGWDTFREMMGF